MGNWYGWLAALGGALVVIELLGVQTGDTLSWIGGIAAIIFGIWSSS